jgi:hypothetical protein
MDMNVTTLAATGRHVSRTGLELTYRAIAAFLSALPASRYDLRAIPADAGCALPQLWQPGAQGLLRLVPTLRARNAEGFHIYVRPLDTAYLLVDDLDPDGLDALRAAGHLPAAVVMTSPHNHQVWLRLGARGAGCRPTLRPRRRGSRPSASAATRAQSPQRSSADCPASQTGRRCTSGRMGASLRAPARDL